MQALLSMYHAQQEYASSTSAVEDVEAALERAGLYRPVRRPPAVSFLDITGYTRLTEERGDEAAAELATRLATLVRGASRRARRAAGQVAGRRRDVLLPEPR